MNSRNLLIVSVTILVCWVGCYEASPLEYISNENEMTVSNNCRDLCSHCGCTGFYCGDECICDCNQNDIEAKCVETMQSNCRKLQLPFEVLIQGPSGNRFVRKQITKVMLEHPPVIRRARSTVSIYQPKNSDVVDDASVPASELTNEATASVVTESKPTQSVIASLSPVNDVEMTTTEKSSTVDTNGSTPEEIPTESESSAPIKREITHEKTERYAPLREKREDTPAESGSGIIVIRNGNTAAAISANGDSPIVRDDDAASAAAAAAAAAAERKNDGERENARYREDDGGERDDNGDNIGDSQRDSASAAAAAAAAAARDAASGASAGSSARDDDSASAAGAGAGASGRENDGGSGREDEETPSSARDEKEPQVGKALDIFPLLTLPKLPLLGVAGPLIKQGIDLKAIHAEAAKKIALVHAEVKKNIAASKIVAATAPLAAAKAAVAGNLAALKAAVKLPVLPKLI